MFFRDLETLTEEKKKGSGFHTLNFLTSLLMFFMSDLFWKVWHIWGYYECDPSSSLLLSYVQNEIFLCPQLISSRIWKLRPLFHSSQWERRDNHILKKNESNIFSLDAWKIISIVAVLKDFILAELTLKFPVYIQNAAKECRCIWESAPKSF